MKLAKPLVREVHPPQQVLEARVVAQGVPLRLHVDVDHPSGALLVSPFEPGQGLLFIFETKIDFSDWIGEIE